MTDLSTYHRLQAEYELTKLLDIMKVEPTNWTHMASDLAYIYPDMLFTDWAHIVYSIEQTPGHLPHDFAIYFNNKTHRFVRTELAENPIYREQEDLKLEDGVYYLDRSGYMLFRQD